MDQFLSREEKRRNGKKSAPKNFELVILGRRCLDQKTKTKAIIHNVFRIQSLFVLIKVDKKQNKTKQQFK